MNMTDNVDQAELAKFDALASRWWDPEGEFRPLHQINPLRLDWIRGHVELSGAKALDIGCGGGILAEAMTAAGARVTAIDMAEGPLAVARLHQLESGVEIDYRRSTAEELAVAEPEHYDIVTCLEMLEHVPDPSQVIRSCAELVRPGGDVVFSTINRNPKSFVFAIVGAVYILRLLPKGTHEYEKFIKPSELEEWARNAGLQLKSSIGLHYNPFTRDYSLGGNLDVNYMMHFTRPDSE
jgi:2-polyprenyl-6-hydroxyphenyl methylase/3-demethylubiquinone-9 3-methyltransferase